MNLKDAYSKLFGNSGYSFKRYYQADKISRTCSGLDLHLERLLSQL